MLFEKQDWVLGKVLQKQSELNGDLPFIQFEDGFNENKNGRAYVEDMAAGERP